MDDIDPNTSTTPHGHSPNAIGILPYEDAIERASEQQKRTAAPASAKRTATSKAVAFLEEVVVK